jgi:periplasmic protein TonB
MPQAQFPLYTQPTAIAAAVVLLHIACLVALQSGLLRRGADLIVPVQIHSELIELPQPVVESPPQPEPKPAPAPQPKVAQKAPAPPPRPPPAPQPLAIQDKLLALAAPVGINTPAPPVPPIEVAQAPALPPAPAVALPAPPAPPAPAKVEMPSSDADYLNNPPLVYPPLSKRLSETGKVVVRVYISPDGVAQKAEVRTSSGFERLDAAALAAVLKWRYVPGKRGGVAEAMWVNVPVTFTLD